MAVGRGERQDRTLVPDCGHAPKGQVWPYDLELAQVLHKYKLRFFKMPDVLMKGEQKKRSRANALLKIFQVLCRSPPIIFFGVAAIGRAAGFSSLRPGPHSPDGQQCHVMVTLLAVSIASE